MNARKLAVYFMFGAVVGTLGDRIHTYWGVLSYPHPLVFGEAWWVPLVMGLGGVALVQGHALLERRLPDAEDPGPPQWRSALAWFAGAYLASGIFQSYAITLTIALWSAFIARALGRPGSRALWLHALFAALFGTLWEASLSSTGAFTYRHGGLLGVPIWLSGLYLHAALCAREIDRTVSRPHVV